MTKMRMTFGIALAVLLGAGCGEDLTEILVVVDSNLGVPGEIDTVRIDVSGTAGGPQTSTGRLSGGTDPRGLPRTVALVHDGGRRACSSSRDRSECCASTSTATASA